MSYIGKSVRFQHRVATGKAGLKSDGKGTRVHVPTPTELVTSDALVLSEAFVDGLAEPRLFLVYAKRDVPVVGADWQTAMAVAFDVPHKGHDAAENELFWWDAMGETTEGKDEILQAIADEGAEKEDSTPLPVSDDPDAKKSSKVRQIRGK